MAVGRNGSGRGDAAAYQGETSFLRQEWEWGREGEGEGEGGLEGLRVGVGAMVRVRAEG